VAASVVFGARTHAQSPDSLRSLVEHAGSRAALATAGLPDVAAVPTAQEATKAQKVLSLSEAIARAVETNLTSIGGSNAVRRAQAQAQLARSTLLPNVVGSVTESVQRINPASLGIRFDVPLPGITLPEVVGPYNVVDARARVTQTVLDRAAWGAYRAAQENVRATEHSLQDARDTVVLAVGVAYLQTIAARARVVAAQAQVDTANTLFRRVSVQRTSGLATPVDLNRAQAQSLLQQQRLLALQAALAKQKIDLARLAGLPPTDEFDLADTLTFSPPPITDVAEALRQATESREDLKAADAHVRSAEQSVAAARAQRLPSIAVSADVGASYSNPTPVQSVFTVMGAVRIPIWEGNRTDAAVAEASALLAQRRAERDDLKVRIEADIRKALLDLQASAGQVSAAEMNVRVSRETLTLTRQRFEAGVSDNVEIVQSQESVAGGEFDYINGVFSHSLAKLDLARAMGRVSEDLVRFLQAR
jgi:outer membrane protein TolC